MMDWGVNFSLSLLGKLLSATGARELKGHRPCQDGE